MSSTARRLRLRRPDVCATCTRSLRAGETAIWDSALRHVRCVECDPESPPSAAPSPADAVGPSAAGSSARREYERRRANRDARVREPLGALGGVVLAISGEPQHQRAWARGAEGEAKLARKLERWTAEHGVVLLHDRCMPGGRANIDHLAIGPSGVKVIDAKRYRGRIAVERRGGIVRTRTEHLVVGGRDRTNLVDGVLARAQAVREILAGGPEATVPVQAMVCFVDGDWPLLGRLEVRGVPVLPPRHAAQRCRADGPLDTASVQQVAKLLAVRLALA